MYMRVRLRVCPRMRLRLHVRMRVCIRLRVRLRVPARASARASVRASVRSYARASAPGACRELAGPYRGPQPAPSPQFNYSVIKLLEVITLQIGAASTTDPPLLCFTHSLVVLRPCFYLMRASGSLKAWDLPLSIFVYGP